MSKVSLLTLAFISGAIAAPAAAATPIKGASLLPEAKLTLAAARAKALLAKPGRITDEELEKEKGGSGLRYSFDIEVKGKPFEVGIDAKTGKLLEVSAEGAHPD